MVFCLSRHGANVTKKKKIRPPTKIIPTPTIERVNAVRTHLNEYLSQLTAREESLIELANKKTENTLHIDQVEELTGLCVSVMLLERISQHEGSSLPKRAIQSLRKRVEKLFSPEDLMRMEVESYDTLCWLVNLEKVPQEEQEKPQIADPQKEEIKYDRDATSTHLINQSIEKKFDVEITYYTQSRGQLNRRTITPLHIEAETYLHAFCHARKDERVFRLSRIAEVHPVDGVPNPKKKTVKAPGKGRNQGELNLS
jgi:hypothetical protein